MSEDAYPNETSPPQIQTALADCIAGAQTAQRKADDYLKLSRGEPDDLVYEACRSMHQFYSSMHEFFLEEQKAIAVILNADRGAVSSKMIVEA
ncbi:hypothetical protein [Methylobacterium nigriterrae]|uniref:hypothetical protein n=1 Tax=Methylobacterium nigriterrae TaxID=3127512 RepID=UPI0030138256